MIELQTTVVYNIDFYSNHLKTIQPQYLTN